jgi:hypothetical protein
MMAPVIKQEQILPIVTPDVQENGKESQKKPFVLARKQKKDVHCTRGVRDSPQGVEFTNTDAT